MGESDLLKRLRELLSLVKDLKDLKELTPLLNSVWIGVCLAWGAIRRSPQIAAVAVVPLAALIFYLVRRNKRKQALFSGNAPARPFVLAVCPLIAPPHQPVWTVRLLAALEELSEYGVKVVPLKHALPPVITKDDARRMGKAHGADAVLWGFVEERNRRSTAEVYLEILETARPYFTLERSQVSHTHSARRNTSYSFADVLLSSVRIEVLTVLGIIQYEAAAYADAVRTLSRIALHSGVTLARKSQVYVLRGNAHFQIGNFDVALNDYEAALEITPDFKIALHNAGVALLKLNRPKAALEVLNRAVQASTGALDRSLVANPTALTHYTRGSIYLYLRQYREAAKDLARACKQEPLDYLAHLNLAYCFERMGDYERAVAKYQECIRIDPACPKAYRNRGDVYQVTRRLDLALDDYRQAEQLGHPDVRVNVAWLWLEQGDRAKALEEVRRAIEKRESNPEAHQLEAVCLIEDDPEGALLAAKRAIELAPDVVEAHEVCAEAHRRLGDELNFRRECAKVEELRREPDVAAFVSRLSPNPHHRQRCKPSQ